MNGRDDEARRAILGRIRSSLRRGPPGDAGGRGQAARAPRFEGGVRPAVEGDLIARFEQKLRAASGMVSRVERLEEVPDLVVAHLQRFGLPPAIVAATGPDCEALHWPNTLSVSRRPAEDGDRASVTVAYAGVAETGTVVMLSGRENPTTLNFLPDDHLVILREGRVVAHLEEVWARIGAEFDALPRTVNLITGPSKTADVEQIIQEGAHGPRRLHVVLVAQPE